MSTASDSNLPRGIGIGDTDPGSKILVGRRWLAFFSALLTRLGLLEATVLGLVPKISGSTAMASGVVTTLFDTNPSGAGLYVVTAYLPNAGAANYTAFATVVSEGTNARIVANNGAALALSLSGLLVQAVQTSGAPQTVRWAYARIGW